VEVLAEALPSKRRAPVGHDGGDGGSGKAGHDASAAAAGADSQVDERELVTCRRVFGADVSVDADSSPGRLVCQPADHAPGAAGQKGKALAEASAVVVAEAAAAAREQLQEESLGRAPVPVTESAGPELNLYPAGAAATRTVGHDAVARAAASGVAGAPTNTSTVSQRTRSRLALLKLSAGAGVLAGVAPLDAAASRQRVRGAAQAAAAGSTLAEMRPPAPAGKEEAQVLLAPGGRV
jgi:hypothetical protein